jgi:hypothetical protein
MTKQRPVNSVSAIYRIPLQIAAITGIGLASALLGDGVWDWLSWLSLAVPIVLTTVYWQKSRPPSNQQP